MIWLQKHMADVCIIFGLVSGIFVLVSWAIGYYANGLYGYHFDLQSCWAGIGAMGVGMVGLFKWLIDSSPWNSKKEQMPNEKST